MTPLPPMATPLCYDLLIPPWNSTAQLARPFRPPPLKAKRLKGVAEKESRTWGNNNGRWIKYVK